MHSKMRCQFGAFGTEVELVFALCMPGATISRQKFCYASEIDGNMLFAEYCIQMDWRIGLNMEFNRKISRDSQHIKLRKVRL